jgi:hypothetical protein
MTQLEVDSARGSPRALSFCVASAAQPMSWSVTSRAIGSRLQEKEAGMVQQHSVACATLAACCLCSCATVDATHVDVAAPPEPLAMHDLVEARDAAAHELANEERATWLARVGVAASAALLAGVGVDLAAAGSVGHAVDPKFHDVDARTLGPVIAGVGFTAGIGWLVFGIAVDHTDAARADLAIAQRRLDLTR